MIFKKPNQDLAFQSLQSGEVVISPSASLDQTQPTPWHRNCRDLFLSLLELSLSGRRMNSTHLVRSLSSSNPLGVLSQPLIPDAIPLLPSPRPRLSKIATNPISLSTSICPFHHLTDLHEIFLPLPLLVLRNAIKIRLKCSHIPRMQRFGRCSKRKLAGMRLMLAGNIAKGKIQL